MENFTDTKSLGPTPVTDVSDMLLIGSVSLTLHDEIVCNC